VAIVKIGGDGRVDWVERVDVSEVTLRLLPFAIIWGLR
jgi:hypothetical protein